MLKLLRRMRTRERIMCGLCALFLLGQIYFDLRLPDFMSELTVLIQTPGTAMSAVWATGGKMLLCTLCSALLSVICAYLAAKIASGFTFGVREDLFHHVSALGQQEMLGFSVPSLITRTTNDITQIQMVIAMGLQALIKAPVMAVWAIIKILGKSTELSLVTAGFVAVICVSVLLIVSSVIPRFRIVQKLTDQINRVARENLTGIHVVHAFNGEAYQNQKFDQANDRIYGTQVKNQHTFAALQPIMILGMNGLALAIFWVGAALLSSLQGSDFGARLELFSNIMVFSTYATFVVMSFMMLVMIFTLLPPAQVSAERINQVLDTRPAILEGSRTEGPERGTVAFEDVSFRYPDAGGDALSHISFRVEQGQTLAIIGATGSGKTTLVSLIARFYDATSGTVRVDGADVRDYSFSGLYRKLGYMTQKAVIFSGTVEENVRFGESPGTGDPKAVDRAVDLAQAGEFVRGLEGGLSYSIAQSGKNLSGGQKQRLSIARALAREPEILIFDDSFSALDYRTDAALRQGLNRELAGTTKIIVAQRISTIRNADEILVLDEGSIVGRGTHEELMAKCAVYREIAFSQLSPEELGKEGA